MDRFGGIPVDEEQTDKFGGVAIAELSESPVEVPPENIIREQKRRSLSQEMEQARIERQQGEAGQLLADLGERALYTISQVPGAPLRLAQQIINPRNVDLIPPETAQKVVGFLNPLPPSQVGSAQAGAERFAAATLSTLTRPEMLAAMAVAPAAPQAVGGLFAADMASQSPQAMEALRQAQTPSEAVESGLGLLTSVALPGMIARGTVPRTTRTDLEVTPRVTGRELPVRPGAPKPKPEPVLPPERVTPEEAEAQAERMTAEATAATEPPPEPPAVSPVERAPVATEATPDPIVAAAFRKNGKVFDAREEGGVTHMEADMAAQKYDAHVSEEDAGFVTQSGKFLTREEAYEHARKTNQIISELDDFAPGQLHTGKTEIKPPPLAQGKAASPPPSVEEITAKRAEQIVQDYNQRERELTAYVKDSDSAQTKLMIASRSGEEAKFTPAEQKIVDAVIEHGGELPDNFGPPGNTYEQTKEYQKALEFLQQPSPIKPLPVAEGKAEPTVPPTTPTVSEAARQVSAIPEPAAAPAIREAKPIGEVSQEIAAKPIPVWKVSYTDLEARATHRPFFKQTALSEGFTRKEAIDRVQAMFGAPKYGEFRASKAPEGSKADYHFTAPKPEPTPPTVQPSPLAPPEAKAAGKIEQEVQKVARTEGQRPAKEVKSELLGRIEEAMHGAPEKLMYSPSEHGTVEINIPGDGNFKVPRNLEALSNMRERVKRLSTSPQGTPRTPSGKELADIDAVVKDALAVWKDPREAIAHLEKQLASDQEIDPGHRAMYERGIELLREQLPENILETKIGLAEQGIRDAEQDVRKYEAEVEKYRNRKRKLTTRQQVDLQQMIGTAERARATLTSRRKELSSLIDEKVELEKRLAKPPAPTPPEAKPVGMGGAVPAEYEKSQLTPTSIKNATVDQERAKRGLQPAMQPARRAFGEVWDRAMSQIDRDPAAQDRLIDQLREKPRALTDMEDAMILHRQIDLQNEYAKATRDLAQAFDDGRMDQVAELKQRVAEWSDKLQDLYDIGKQAGTETGRGLNARKMLAYEDFTLAKLETETRAAKGGAPLTDQERAYLMEVEKRFNETQAAYDAYVKQAQARIIDLEMKARMAELEKQAKAEPKIPEVIIRVAEKIVNQLDVRADAARQRIRERMARVSAGVDPTVLLDLAEIGASHIGHIGLDFAKWSARMVEDMGDWVKPHLQQVFKASQETIDRLSIPERVKRTVKKQTPKDEKQEILSKVTELIDKNENARISFFLQKLARMFYEEGIHQREPMVSALHQFMQQVKPEITREEVARAWSGYGDYRQLSKDQITVALRGMKGELQQIAKLEDMAAGVPPAKSGQEQRTATEAERQLKKLVNDAKYKFQVPVQDPNTQLKSALDTLKTTLRNRIVDYEDRMARGDYAPRPRREIILDKEAQRLKAENERVKIRYQYGLNKYRQANRTKFQKIGDAFVKWERAFKLSSPVVFGKLSAAALTRLATTGTEEVVGTMLGKLPGIAGVARRAPREAGINVRGMAKGLAEAFTSGMRDAAQTAKTGATDLDIILGKKGGADPDWVNFFGQLHGMMKAPIKRAEYELSLRKRLEWAIKNGVDTTDPLVQMRLQAEAMNDGYRTIFMQRGFTADMFNMLVRAMEQSKKYPTSGYLTARMMRFIFPIVRVPINIVSETFTGVHGFATASARTMFHAMNTGLKDLDPVVADSIMRQFKKGSIGAALMAIGYMNADKIGGYDWREKRRPGTPKTMQFRIFDTDIPKWMTHAPWFELMQMGSTIRRVKEQHVASTGQEKGITEGAWAAGLGLLDETPFYGEMVRATRGVESPGGRMQFGGELARGSLIPQAVQWAAKLSDEDVRRKPRTLGEHLKMGIPGLRQEVPLAPNR